MSSFSSYCQLVTSLRIEPVMFLFIFSYILNNTCLTNLLLDKGCLHYYNYSSDICGDLHNKFYEHERNNVEILANNYNLYLNLLVSIGAFVMTFLSPWSDNYGRKPILISALFGFLINDIGIILCTIFFDSSLIFVLISNLPTQLSGGFIAIMTIIYCHASEVSSEKSRSMKYMLVQISFELGVTFGALAGGQLYRFYGYLGVFTVMSIGHLIALLWVILVVAETRGLDTHTNLQKKLWDLMTFQAFTNSLYVCLKSRPKFGRRHLWLLIFSSCAIALTYSVFTNINYLYIHHMYKWNPTIYSEIWAIFSLSEMIVLFVSSFVFIKYFKFNDPLIGLIGSISIIGKNLFLAFAADLKLYYFSNIFGFLHSFGSLAIKSMISKLIMEEELGRVFSFLTTCEAIVPLVGSVAIAQVFNSTIEVFPGSCYIAATIFLIFPLCTFLYELILLKWNSS